MVCFMHVKLGLLPWGKHTECENNVVRTILGLTENEITGEWRTF